MELSRRLLEQFVTVAEEGHVGRAAERLGMRQPPLSQALQRLERSLGAALLVREARGVRPTPAGEAFAADARRLLEAQQAAVERVRRIADGAEGVLRVGCAGAFAYSFPAELLRVSAARLPGLRIDLSQGTDTHIAELVRDGRCDLGFVREPVPTTRAQPGPEQQESDGLVIVPGFFTEHIVAALPVAHALAGATELNLAELRGDSFVLPEPLSMAGLAARAAAACREAGFEPRVGGSCDDVTSALGYVATGLYVTLVPEGVRHFSPPGIAYVPLRTPSPQMISSIAAIHRPGADRAVQRVLDLLAEPTRL
ncbi:LysR family transcriptional regulator [Streptomyces cavernicola]|uniref:LysR family transcriptional regulator n=1 Tax=Streptomyces cavernicola TaxID=3043613 RepID=A0ABT6SLF8_9ACTN|nr:LysR family transcriptional regulator [Streptomyces sp. B-S-A6]MDI3409025.1 LysR family transcriptional regulator [Streptomyces sp. B-S-A6]